MRKDRAAKLSRKRRNTKLIFIGVIAAVAIAIGFGVSSYVQNPPRTASFGAVGSAHEHAAFRLFIQGESVDFSLPKYQQKSQFIHFEGGGGDIVHRHATLVDMGYLFETFGMEFTSECLMMGDGTEYCNDGTNTLKFYVNGARNSMYSDYVLMDGDGILLSYGAEEEEQVDEQLKELDEIEISG